MQAGERPGNCDLLLQVLIQLQVSPEEDRDSSSSFKKIQRAFKNNQTGERHSYEVWMPIVREFCKENAPKLFDAMHIATIEAQHNKTSGDGQNIYYQATKLLAKAFMDKAAEREPEIWEQVNRGKLALGITKEKHEDGELKEQEESYHQSLLELAIEDGSGSGQQDVSGGIDDPLCLGQFRLQLRQRQYSKHWSERKS